MSRRRQVAFAGAAAALAMMYIALSPAFFPSYRPDFDQLWEAAAAWLRGENPYEVVGRIHRARGDPVGVLYPFPAMMLALPLVWLPVEWARVVVVGAGTFTLAYLILGRRPHCWPLLLSGAFRASVSLVQLTPFAASAILAPAFGWIAAMKPNIGAAVFAAGRDFRWATRFLVSAAVVTALSFVLYPGWVAHWRASLATATHLAPLIAHPLGWVMPLALLRWRRPEARWLMASVLMPGTPAVYDALPLLILLPQSLRQSLVFALLSHVADIGAYFVPHGPGMAGVGDARRVMLLAALYLPALALLLSRPNASDEPAVPSTLDSINN